MPTWPIPNCTFDSRVGPTCGSPSLPKAPATIEGVTSTPGPAELQRMLDDLPSAVEPLDVVMLDGFLCGVLLRERPLPPQRWLPLVFDIEGRSVPGRDRWAPLRAAVLSRHDALGRAIEQRRWFDPWVFELVGAQGPTDALMPWAAGFALAEERFAPDRPADAEARQARALIYQFVSPAHWPAAAALADEVADVEPPQSLADGVEDVVSGVLLLADAIGIEPRSERSGRG